MNAKEQASEKCNDDMVKLVTRMQQIMTEDSGDNRFAVIM
jgi:hypothetical protein